MDWNLIGGIASLVAIVSFVVGGCYGLWRWWKAAHPIELRYPGTAYDRYPDTRAHRFRRFRRNVQYIPFGESQLAGDHGIGSCSVTSLRPSGKVASTCTSSTSSGTPSST